MKSLLFLVGFLYSFISIAQIPIFFNHTYDGNVIFGDYHSYLESEYSEIRIPLEMEFSTLEKGYYKLVNDPKVRGGYINFNSKKVIIKENDVKPIKKKRIKISEVEYLKLGVDSFFVINKIKNDNIISDKERLVKHIASFDSIAYAQCFNFEINGTLRNKFFIRKKVSEQVWSSVILKGESLKDNPLMTFEKLNKNTFRTKITEEEFLESIKEVQYFDKLRSDDKLYFSKNWEQIENKKEACYFSKVNSKEGSIYAVEYYTINGQKLYDVNYSSFNPNVKTGEFKLYDKGVLLEKRMYSENNLESLSSYSKEGDLNYSYTSVKTNKKEPALIVFETITTIEGEKITSPINGEYFLKNTSSKIKHLFKDSRIINSYYVNEGTKICFFNGEKNIDISLFQIGLSQYLDTNELFNTKKYSENLEGTILLDVITDRKGKVVSYEILNKLNTSLDRIFKNFCFIKLSKNASFKIKFKNIQLTDKKSNCRFLLPVIFTHNRFHETFIKPNNNHYSDFFFHLWQQQFFRQQFPLQPQIKLPTINRL